MKIDCYEIGVYPRRLWVVIGDDMNEIKKTFTYQNGDEIDLSNEIDLSLAMTISVTHKKTGKFGCLVWFSDTSEMSADIVAHESVHAALSVFNAVQCYVTYDNQEPFAYLVSWMVGKIQESKEKCLKKVK